MIFVRQPVSILQHIFEGIVAISIFKTQSPFRSYIRAIKLGCSQQNVSVRTVKMLRIKIKIVVHSCIIQTQNGTRFLSPVNRRILCLYV
jgi:hypothetical protein